MASMPGNYAAPASEILLARDWRNSNALGCVAMRQLPLPGCCCKMKRLYFRPDVRGLGLGSALVKAVLSVAKDRGYEQIKLDTLGSMSAALRLYEKVVFRVIQAYYDTPIEGTVFLARHLNDVAL
jgi:ribosomal protein S18 acetylase RimI-like enzyme